MKSSARWIAMTVMASSATALGQQPEQNLIPDREANRQLAHILDSTRAQGLPVAPIVAKAQYAAVMHAPADKILAAARAIAARLPIARAALAPRDNTADVIAGEGALSFGVSKETIRAIRQASAEPSIAVPLGVLTELVASHVPIDRASELVLALVKRGASSQQLAALQTNVAADVGFGVPPDQSLELRTKGLTAVLGGGAAGGSAPVNIAKPKNP